eukprot:CAMPEP_0119339866 /NCGR_PEP_ID=MMETSP1333-20130426/99236_1 /TAXON_ID=418940 /ORGANISM="Scyphosphaera apsteinii, Strain RCC1455" /LENGTH=59 /DNA_ID=CAMNT_0007351487 /DNA_START=59 /DNA_END=234 /DNA_ORIENTATION=-
MDSLAACAWRATTEFVSAQEGACMFDSLRLSSSKQMDLSYVAIMMEVTRKQAHPLEGTG